MKRLSEPTRYRRYTATQPIRVVARDLACGLLVRLGVRRAEWRRVGRPRKEEEVATNA